MRRSLALHITTKDPETNMHRRTRRARSSSSNIPRHIFYAFSLLVSGTGFLLFNLNRTVLRLSQLSIRIGGVFVLSIAIVSLALARRLPRIVPDRTLNWSGLVSSTFPQR